VNQLKPVAERIVDVAASNARNVSVVLRLNASGPKSCHQSIVVMTTQSRMRFLRGTKIFLNAQMNLDHTALEPASAALGEFWRLGNLGHTQQFAVESSSLRFGARRHRELHVLDSTEWGIGHKIT